MTIRRAHAEDGAAVADVYLRARHRAVPSIPPLVHTDAEVRRWIAEVLLPRSEVWVAVADALPQALIGVMALDDDWIDQLYLDPDHTGNGHGTRLLSLAKRLRPGGLQLWTFATNVRAQRFYERRDFTVAERTDGSGNEEHTADIRYVWRPGAPTLRPPTTG